MLRVKDVPPDQMAELVRVAGELYGKEQADTQERRCRRADLAAGIGAAVAIGGGWLVTHTPSAAPITYSFQNPAQQWDLNNSPDVEGGDNVMGRVQVPQVAGDAEGQTSAVGGEPAVVRPVAAQSPFSSWLLVSRERP